MSEVVVREDGIYRVAGEERDEGNASTILGVSLRIMESGQHVASMLPSPCHLPLPPGWFGDAIYHEPSVPYSHGEQWERDEVLLAAYRQNFMDRFGRWPANSWNLEEWRKGLPFLSWGEHRLLKSKMALSIPIRSRDARC